MTTRRSFLAAVASLAVSPLARFGLRIPRWATRWTKKPEPVATLRTIDARGIQIGTVPVYAHGDSLIGKFCPGTPCSVVAWELVGLDGLVMRRDEGLWNMIPGDSFDMVILNPRIG